MERARYAWGTVQHHVAADASKVPIAGCPSVVAAHAFAISVHKTQGSECCAVVMPLLTQHYMMLQRNLLYTSVTRAKELVALVGMHKAIGIAIKSDKVAQRNARLAVRECFLNDQRSSKLGE